MRSLATRIVLFSVFVVLMAGTSPGQRRQDQELTPELYTLVDKRTDEIKRAIAGSSTEWAGTYAAGDHHPTIFMWAPDEGFLITSSLHTFSPSWVNYGEVSINGSVLSTRSILPDNDKYAHVIAPKLRMVKWGEQHFLIPSDELKSFAYAVHSRAESEIVQYFVRWEDHEKTRRGLPDLPAEFVRYMKMAPITAVITAVGPTDGPSQEVALSVGRRHNVIEGMIFYFARRNGAQFSVRVREVSDAGSKGEVWSTSGSDDGFRIRRGLRLTSRIPNGFFEPG